MIDEPTVVTTVEHPVATLRLTVPRNEIQKVMGPGKAELLQEVARQGVKVTGPWFTHHLRMAPGIFDFEIGVPVQTAIEPQGRFSATHWPATRVARTILKGSYEGLGRAWQDLDAWLVAQGHRPADELWESYLVGPEATFDSTQWQTELFRPLAI